MSSWRELRRIESDSYFKHKGWRGTLYHIKLPDTIYNKLHKYHQEEKTEQSYLAWVITGFPLAHPLEDMVQPKDVAHLMDHSIVVTSCTKVWWVQHHPAWGQKVEFVVWAMVLLLSRYSYILKSQSVTLRIFQVPWKWVFTRYTYHTVTTLTGCNDMVPCPSTGELVYCPLARQ